MPWLVSKPGDWRNWCEVCGLCTSYYFGYVLPPCMPGAYSKRTPETQRSQTCLIGYSIVWLPERADARNVYYVQSLSSVSLVVIGYLYGGFLSDKTVTAYHALLIVYLTMGNVVSGMFVASNVQMRWHPYAVISLSACQLPWLFTWAYSSECWN